MLAAGSDIKYNEQMDGYELPIMHLFCTIFVERMPTSCNKGCNFRSNNRRRECILSRARYKSLALLWYFSYDKGLKRQRNKQNRPAVHER
jgi:hypothetical protein